VRAGELLTVTDGPIQVGLLPELGGRLHRLRAFGHDMLRTPERLETHRDDPYFWGAYAMAPWSNRLSTEPTPVGGRVVRLPATFPDGTAIHGQVATVPWTVRDDGSFSVRGGGGAWPWAYEVEQRVAVADARVRIDLALTNLADGPMPAGLGLHPWFRRPLEVRLAGSRVVRSNTDPAATLEGVSGDLDLRQLRPVPDDLDATWTDLEEPALELRWPELGLTAEVRIHADAGPCVALASPADLDAVAIEPQTHLPDGLGRHVRGEPGGLRLLAPGATLRLTTEWLFRR